MDTNRHESEHHGLHRWHGFWIGERTRPRVLVIAPSRSRTFREGRRGDCLGGPPKPTREARVLPRINPCYPRHPGFSIFCRGSRAGCNPPVSQATRLPLQPYKICVHWCPFVVKKKAPRGFTPPGAVFCIRWELSLALLRTGRKLDVAAVLQVDPERVGRVLSQVTGGHVEDPLATAPAEGNVRDIGVSFLVHVVRAPTGWALTVWGWAALISDPAGAVADCCGPPTKGAIKPINVKVVICSATIRAAPTSFFMPAVRRIILLIF
jgi:hypothetical protein